MAPCGLFTGPVNRFGNAAAERTSKPIQSQGERTVRGFPQGCRLSCGFQLIFSLIISRSGFACGNLQCFTLRYNYIKYYLKVKYHCILRIRNPIGRLSDCRNIHLGRS